MMHRTEKSTPAPMSEKYRPQFHFSPATSWTNDPNGLVWFKGEYHLFYQHNPDKSVWGPMHWGHAVSNDLVHWQHLPIALYPDSLGYIFSGSAVVDYNNTSGLGSINNPPMILIYTYHNIKGERAGRADFQSQALAYSTDKGRTWTKYDGNPILPNAEVSRDFRDPKLMWDDKNKQWVMTLAVKDHVEFYVSANLKNWQKSGEFGKTAGAHGGVWECPDLIQMRAENGEEKFVLLVSINPGAPNGGSGTQYFVGAFNGKTFQNDMGDLNSGWVDYGTDNYAGVTFANVPGGRIISMGWMSNWIYAQIVPTTVWRNAMTVPRELTLKKINSRFVLTSAPVSELEQQRGNGLEFNKTLQQGDSIISLPDLPSDNVELLMNIENGARQNLTIELKNAIDEQLTFGFNVAKNEYYIDREKSGEISFSDHFGATHFAPRIANSSSIKLRLLIDASSIEVFADDGTSVMTDLIFPKQPYKQISIKSAGEGVSTKGKIFSLKSIWQ
jgi:fructan beta-fructosidase